ncbi:oligosaccharide flippase family protein [Bradyrhizobium sp. CNPSo 4010]|uniref:Oligosaccharide flippase family protein n=1 Tax=Bradyrhizobium agreste TaxID=2751811 RepID=A0ABS0PM59_9BRAD|nr:oligosaccharide flippase family protein [Bradyrhizobium agreste]
MRECLPSVHRSIVLSALDRYANFALFFVATAVLSRLLTPQEFGLYAIANALTAVIAASFQEFGGANYLIQKRDLSHASLRTAFTVTLAVSSLIGVTMFAGAGALSRLFEQDSLRRGLEVSALNFLLLPVSGTVSALFRRDMEFGKLALCNLAGGCSGSIASMALAMWGFSYMAPIWGSVVGNLILAVLLLSCRPDRSWFRLSLAEYRDVIGFGLYSSGVAVINVFYNLAPQLFLAKILDVASVGLYSRAINITQVFDKVVVQVLNPVIMPAIVAQTKGRADLRQVYLEAIELLSAVQWPFLISVAIVAQPLILIWLGPTWLEIVPLVRLLCIANLFLFAACLSYPVLVAVGSIRDALSSSLISLPPSLLVILCASFFGVQAVAASALLTLPFQAVVVMYFIGQHIAVGPRDLARGLIKSGVVTAITGSGVASCAALIQAGIATPLAGLIAAFVAAPLCWWLGLLLTAHPLLRRIQDAASGLAVVAPRHHARRS